MQVLQENLSQKAPEREFISTKCPAWNKKCLECDQLGHFKYSEACKKVVKEKPKASVLSASEPAMFSSVKLAGVKGINMEQGVHRLSHVEWDTEKQHWKHRKPSKMEHYQNSLASKNQGK